MNKHLVHIGINAIRTFILPFTLFVVSYFVVNYYTKELWGEFVTSLLLVNLIVHFLQAGSKDYLIRHYSQKPSQISALFYRVLLTRAVFLLPTLIIIVLLQSDLTKAFFIFLWVVGLFIYQSAESLIVYSKKFTVQVLSEIIAFIVMVSGLLFFKDYNATNLILLFTVSTWVKTFIISIKIFPKTKTFSLNFRELLILFPFFLIGLSGLLQSRIDQYIIALFCDKTTIASYQIFLSVFILLQAISAIFIIPYNKIIYRINGNTFNRLNRTFALWGIACVALGVVSIKFIISYFYDIELAPMYYLFGALFAYPSFVYGAIILLLYRINKEKEVMWVGYAGALLNLTSTFICVWYKQPFMAIASSAITQWVLLAWYLFRKKAIISKIYKQ